MTHLKLKDFKPPKKPLPGQQILHFHEESLTSIFERGEQAVHFYKTRTTQLVIYRGLGLLHSRLLINMDVLPLKKKKKSLFTDDPCGTVVCNYGFVISVTIVLSVLLV